MVGAAGRAFEEKMGYKLGRITGLDPASPCFYHFNPSGPKFAGGTLRSLSKTDARFVDVIHTNGGQLGVKEEIGHYDFYPNGGEEQPGCGDNMKCSHERAPKLFAETIGLGNENRHMAIRNIFRTKDNLGTRMGYATISGEHLSGSYFLTTESESDPYGSIQDAFETTALAGVKVGLMALYLHITIIPRSVLDIINLIPINK